MGSNDRSRCGPKQIAAAMSTVERLLSLLQPVAPTRTSLEALLGRWISCASRRFDQPRCILVNYSA